MFGVVICATVVLLCFLGLIIIGQSVTEHAIKYFKENM